MCGYMGDRMEILQTVQLIKDIGALEIKMLGCMAKNSGLQSWYY